MLKIIDLALINLFRRHFVISIAIIIASQTACAPIQEHAKRVSHARNMVADSAIEEYVNRVGKRISIVTERNESPVIYKVTGNIQPYLNLEQNNTIVLSYGLLQELNNEAELAAVLTKSMLEYNSLLKYSNIDEQLLNDKYTIIYLTRAGYDPKAFVLLQEKYAKRGKLQWLSNIFNNSIPSIHRITANKIAAENAQAGLLRGEERYKQHVGI